MEKESGEHISSRTPNLSGKTGSGLGGIALWVHGSEIFRDLNDLQQGFRLGGFDCCCDKRALRLANARKRLASTLCFCSSVSSGDGGDESEDIGGGCRGGKVSLILKIEKKAPFVFGFVYEAFRSSLLSATANC